MMTERRWSTLSQWSIQSPPPAYRNRYEMKAVFKTRMDEKPSVPCGALPNVRAMTAKYALRGINQRLPCGA
jgi:hypothetical protein